MKPNFVSFIWLCSIFCCCLGQEENVTTTEPSVVEFNSTTTTVVPLLNTFSSGVIITSTQKPEVNASEADVIYIPGFVGPDFNAIRKTLIPQLLNVSENIVDERDKEAELLAWEAPIDLQANYPYYLSGFDAENRPIWICELGKWNIRKVVEAGGTLFDNFDRYVQQARLRITNSRALRSTPDHVVNEGVFLVDLDKFDLGQVTSVPTVTYILSLARQYRKLLTEHTGVAVVVNANFVAETLVNLVRPVLSSILEKTEIYGSQRNRWLPAVLRHFPKDQIPEWYGGSKGYTPVKVFG